MIIESGFQNIVYEFNSLWLPCISGVTAIVVGSGIGYTSSNHELGSCILCFANTLGKGIKLFSLQLWMNSRRVDFNLGMATGLGEGKLSTLNSSRSIPSKVHCMSIPLSTKPGYRIYLCRYMGRIVLFEKILVLDWNTWNYIKSANLKNVIQHWKYIFDYNKKFRN